MLGTKKLQILFLVFACLLIYDEHAEHFKLNQLIKAFKVRKIMLVDLQIKRNIPKILCFSRKPDQQDFSITSIKYQSQNYFHNPNLTINQENNILNLSFRKLMLILKAVDVFQQPKTQFSQENALIKNISVEKLPFKIRNRGSQDAYDHNEEEYLVLIAKNHHIIEKLCLITQQRGKRFKYQTNQNYEIAQKGQSLLKFLKRKEL